MTDTIKDGGAAFPCTVDGVVARWVGVGKRGPVPLPGMSLRDWFAGQALTGIMGPNYDWFTSGGETGSRTHEAASFAYSLADAMIAAREGGAA